MKQDVKFGGLDPGHHSFLLAPRAREVGARGANRADEEDGAPVNDDACSTLPYFSVALFMVDIS